MNQAARLVLQTLQRRLQLRVLALRLREPSIQRVFLRERCVQLACERRQLGGQRLDLGLQLSDFGGVRGRFLLIGCLQGRQGSAKLSDLGSLLVRKKEKEGTRLSFCWESESISIFEEVREFCDWLSSFVSSSSCLELYTSWPSHRTHIPLRASMHTTSALRAGCPVSFDDCRTDLEKATPLLEASVLPVSAGWWSYQFRSDLSESEATHPVAYSRASTPTRSEAFFSRSPSISAFKRSFSSTSSFKLFCISKKLFSRS